MESPVIQQLFQTKTDASAVRSTRQGGEGLWHKYKHVRTYIQGSPPGCGEESGASAE